MKTLGMIGGTSWHATVEYYKAINEKVGEAQDNMQSPPLIIYSINIEVMRSGDQNRIKETYLEVSQKLEAAGAEAIVICANTPHLVCDSVQPQIGIPFLHIASATGNEARSKGMKTLGLLGTLPTMEGEFITGILDRDYGMRCLKPEGSNFQKTHDYISKELTRGIFSAEAKAFYTEQIRAFAKGGADGVILGCTELPILLRDAETALPLLSTTDLHANMAADFVLEES
ncbi:MAG: aspartate/glutamate racemase family protein [Cryomorphaceae bacterium]|nr:amino acid racemase [Flavobacteriales bacterium]